MTIVMSGGGSGGHITPILAVASEIKRQQPETRIVFIGQTGDKLSDIPAQHPAIDAVYTIRAGKFRRYHGQGIKQLFDIPTQAKNVRDAFWTLTGLWQSFWLLRRLKPQVIFTRGGFVSVPVALGGKLNGIPYVTHDADSVPSLANRIIARWAALHAVALPENLYPYPKATTVMVGVPVSGDYVPVDKKLQQKYRGDLGLSRYKQVLLVTGGGNGADALNASVIACAAELLAAHPDLAIVHVAGRALETGVQQVYDKYLPPHDRGRVIVKGFVTDLYKYSGAADVLILRAGAITLAEAAIQAKACIVVPAAHLVGGHQTKNAQVLAARRAIRVLTEQQAREPVQLLAAVAELLDDQAERRRLGSALAQLARPDAARHLAMLLLDQA